VTSKFFEYIVGDNCTTLGVKNFTLSNIAMYPNPVSNELTIEAKNTIQKVEVFNLLGQQVLSINPKANSAKIQTSSLSKGVYVITATIDDVVSSSKFITINSVVLLSSRIDFNSSKKALDKSNAFVFSSNNRRSVLDYAKVSVQ
jgi:hypothetical protein